MGSGKSVRIHEVGVANRVTIAPGQQLFDVDFGNANQPPALLGDFNRNNTVDAADYVLWRKTLTNTVSSPYTDADGNGNGVVDAADYGVWRGAFGNVLGSGTGSTGTSEENTSLIVENTSSKTQGILSLPPTVPEMATSDQVSVSSAAADAQVQQAVKAVPVTPPVARPTIEAQVQPPAVLKQSLYSDLVFGSLTSSKSTSGYVDTVKVEQLASGVVDRLLLASVDKQAYQDPITECYRPRTSIEDLTVDPPSADVVEMAFADLLKSGVAAPL